MPAYQTEYPVSVTQHAWPLLRQGLRSLFLVLPLISFAAAIPVPVAISPSRDIGYLDVTQEPFRADPTGERDSTEAIQHAVIAARDARLVCFFPSGTYVISDTISCEQPVHKRDRPAGYDGHTQHYWGDRDHPCILMGPAHGPRPVLRLRPKDHSFTDPAMPKPALYVWAQTRDDAPGKDEPEWGKEQPNISFNQIVRGIDIDVRGSAGAIGLRHAGSQGSTAEDMTILAEGAFAGLYNCPGQGGGTFNIEVIGGDYGLYATAASRFPLLVGCAFRHQRKAAVRYDGVAIPLLIVGFTIEQDHGCAVALTNLGNVPGVLLKDGVIDMKGGDGVFETAKPENLLLRNVWTRGVSSIVRGFSGTHLERERWQHVEAFASCAEWGRTFLDSEISSRPVLQSAAAAMPPEAEQLRRSHLWNEQGPPSPTATDVVNLKRLGAKGDGVTDDTAVLKAAIAKYKNIFLPKGVYLISDTIELGADTTLFGTAPLYTEIRAAKSWGRAGTPMLTTVDDVSARTVLADLTLSHRDVDRNFTEINWRAGRHSMLRHVCAEVLWTGDAATLITAAPIDHQQFTVTGSGGGHWYAVNSNEGSFTSMSGHPHYRALLVHGTTEPLAIYGFNAERLRSDVLVEIADSANVDLYYLKTEAMEIDSGDCRTDTLRIRNSHHIGVYAINGLVSLRPGGSMVTLENSTDIWVAGVRSFRPSADYALVQETFGDASLRLDGSFALSVFHRGSGK